MLFSPIEIPPEFLSSPTASKFVLLSIFLATLMFPALLPVKRSCPGLPSKVVPALSKELIVFLRPMAIMDNPSLAFGMDSLIALN